MHQNALESVTDAVDRCLIQRQKGSTAKRKQLEWTNVSKTKKKWKKFSSN